MFFWHFIIRQVKKKGKTPIGAKSQKNPLYMMKYPKELRLPPDAEDDLPQSEAKAYLPPRCSVWRDNMKGGWHFHLAGHRRKSVAWARFGGNSRAAMLEAMRTAWRLFLEDNCLTTAQCPIQGIFT